MEQVSMTRRSKQASPNQAKTRRNAAAAAAAYLAVCKRKFT